MNTLPRWLVAVLLVVLLIAALVLPTYLVYRQLNSTPIASDGSQVDEARLAVETANSLNVSFSVFLALIQVVGVLLAFGAFFGLRDLAKEREDLVSKVDQAVQAKDRLTATVEDLNAKVTNVQRIGADANEALKKVREIDDDLEDRTQRAILINGFVQLAQRQIARDSSGESMRYAIRLLEDALELTPEPSGDSIDATRRLVLYYLGDLRVRSKDQVEQGLADLEIASDRGKSKFTPANISYAYAMRVKGDNMGDPTEKARLYNKARELFRAHWGDIDVAAPPEGSNRDLLDVFGESAFGAFGGLYKQEGNWDSARKVYQAVCEITPSSSYAHNNLGQCFFKLGRETDARAQFATVKRLADTKLALNERDYWALQDVITSSLVLGPMHGESPDEYRERILKTTRHMIAESPDAESRDKFARGLDAIMDYAPDRELVQMVIDEITPPPSSDIAG